MGSRMLTEPVILSLLKRFLKARGYTNIAVVNGRTHGDDLRATPPKGNFALHVEAKGQTSSMENSKRFGRPFSHAQIRDHMATAIYKALCMRSQSSRGAKRQIALALPDIPSKRNVYGPVASALRELDIGVFWVAPDRSIKLDARWKL
jgi:hypothetical protein